MREPATSRAACAVVLVVVALVALAGQGLAARGAAARAGAPAGAPAGAQALVAPLDGEASFGEVVAQGPVGARDAVLLVGGRWAGRVHLTGDGRARFRVPAGAAGPRAVAVRFLGAGGAELGRVAARRVWLLPAAAARSVAVPAVRDAALASRLEELGEAFPGYAGLYAANLATGRWASWNGDAAFLAASTVKVGLMLEALRRFGPWPERSSAWPDIVAAITVSSNDAANRLLARIGGGSDEAGSRAVDTRFDALGATSTRFPGPYPRAHRRAGAAAQAPARAGALDMPRPTPFLPWRRTTARDLGRIVAAIHAAAAGDLGALQHTGLTLHEARLALALLLDAEPEGGALAGALRPGLPVAQKTGWRSDVRNAAAVVYAPDGPRVVVVLTYAKPEVSTAAVARLARGVAALEGVGP